MTPAIPENARPVELPSAGFGCGGENLPGLLAWGIARDAYLTEFPSAVAL